MNWSKSECAAKGQVERDNAFTLSVLQRCYKLVSELRVYKGLNHPELAERMER